eukprot:gene1418-15482_t
MNIDARRGDTVISRIELERGMEQADLAHLTPNLLNALDADRSGGIDLS